MDLNFTHSNGINMKHLSASTINSFIERRPSWYDTKVAGKPFEPNPAMARGTAVEHAINEWLVINESSRLADIAIDKYEKELATYLPNASSKGREDYQKFRDSIPALVECAYEHFSTEFTMNRPIAQAPIEVELDGVKRKVKGYLDYLTSRMVIDCKVSSKTPSSLSQGYIIQGALYYKATGLPVQFHFIIDNKTPKSHVIQLTDDDIVFGLSYATRAAEVLEELEECDQPKRIMELMAFPNLAALWNIEEKIEAAKRYGIKLR